METIDIIDKSTCYNCKLCAWECPKEAISFSVDDYGFSYPKVDNNACINCGKCVKTCPTNGIEGRQVKKVYAAIYRENSLLKKSSSGGVFAAVAKVVLSRGGVVYGATLEKDIELVLRAKHIRIDSEEDIEKLQGSKYVQSDISGIFPLLEKDLSEGREVVFSGTPCQVAAIRTAFGESENLLLVDVICHGVPSQEMFSDYLSLLKKKYPKIENFYFRSKDSGWGLCAKLEYIDKKGRNRKKIIPCDISSYYKLFLQSVIYRENCYRCTYAKAERVSDLTLGDYWGVENNNNLYKSLKDEGVEISNGVSAVLACTKKGDRYLKEANLVLVDSDFENVSLANKQLSHPSNKPRNRTDIMETYKSKGYIAVEKKFQKSLGLKKYIVIIKNKIPHKWKHFLKKLFNR